MGNAASVASNMEAWALKKWVRTELYVRQFSNQAEEEMRSEVRASGWGPDTGALDSAIQSEEKSLGVFSLEVTTFIEDIANPITGESTNVYGNHINNGHFNIYLKESIPPVQFMEIGSHLAHVELLAKLANLW